MCSQAGDPASAQRGPFANQSHLCEGQGQAPPRASAFVSLPVKLAKSNLHASTLLTAVTGVTAVSGVTVVSGGVTVGMGSGGPSGGTLPDSSTSAGVQGSSVVSAAKSSSSLGP